MLVKREPLLVLLFLLFAILSVFDPSLPVRSPKLVDQESVIAIVTFLLVSRGLELSGVFDRAAGRIVRSSGGSEFKLLSMMAITTALSSGVIMNDTAIFIFVPLLLVISKKVEIDLPKSVIVISIAANTGSALSPVGNPQNIIIWRVYEVPVWRFVSSMFPYVVLWFILLLLFIWVKSGRKLEAQSLPRIKINPYLAATSALLLAIDVLLIERGLAPLALVLTLILMAIVGRGAIFALDAALVAIFVLIFIDFRELSLLLSHVELKCTGFEAILLSVGLTQIMSNVPATVLLASKNLPWLPLAVGVNLGGNGLVIGSLANFIAIRISGIGLKDFHRYSIPYFLLAFAITLLASYLTGI